MLGLNVVALGMNSQSYSSKAGGLPIGLSLGPKLLLLAHCCLHIADFVTFGRGTRIAHTLISFIFWLGLGYFIFRTA